jgi:ABC-2 type transport system permease protein
MIRLTWTGVLRAEVLKLVTLRSALATYAAIAAMLVVTAGVVLTLPAGDGSGDALLTLILFVELLVGIAGVVASTGEYSAHTMRGTLAAVPRRRMLLAAKLLVHPGIVAALMVPATLVALVAASVLAPGDIGSPTDGEVLRGLAGGMLVFAATAAFGVTIGVLVRSTPAAIGILFAVMILPLMVTVSPKVTAPLPARTAPAIMLTDNPPEAQLLAPGPATVALIGWVVLATAAATAALVRRDA